MRLRLLAATLFIGLLAGSGSWAQGPWKELQAKAQGFAVSMPGEPDHQKQTIRSPSGPLQVNVYTFQRPSTIYSVTCVEYPEGAIQPDSAEQIVRQAKDGMSKSLEGKVVAERELSLSGNPGREFQCNMKNGMFARVRIYLVKNRMYEVVVATLPENRAGGDLVRFLNSFRLLPE
jgi:hypothetical protein